MKSRKRSEAARKALSRYPKGAVSRAALSRQAREAAEDKTKGERVSAGRRAARTRARTSG